MFERVGVDGGAQVLVLKWELSEKRKTRRRQPGILIAGLNM